MKKKRDLNIVKVCSSNTNTVPYKMRSTDSLEWIIEKYCNNIRSIFFITAVVECQIRKKKKELEKLINIRKKKKLITYQFLNINT